MKPARFEYFAPDGVLEAVSVLAQHAGEAKVIAGGQSLVPLLNMRLARPAALVDLNRIPELDYIREGAAGLSIGAMTRQRTVERSEPVRHRLPVLHEAVRNIAHPQIRNRGTVGGSLAHVDPSAELPAVALLLEARLTVVGPRAQRVLAADEFFLSFLTTSLEPDEVLTEVYLPALPPGAGWSFIEFTRRHGDFALAGATAVIALDSSGACNHARLAIFGVGARPLRSPGAEQMLTGERPVPALLEAAASAASQEIQDPIGDIHASPEFRRHLARTLTVRALAQAVERAADLGGRS